MWISQLPYKTLGELINHHETPFLKNSQYMISAKIQTDHKLFLKKY